MIVDGKKIAESILAKIGDEVRTLEHSPVLAIIAVAPNFAHVVSKPTKQCGSPGFVCSVCRVCGKAFHLWAGAGARGRAGAR